MAKYVGALLLAVMSGVLAACNPFYVTRAAIEQGFILASRRPIEKILEEPQGFSAEEKEKLALVLEARNFAPLLGLQPGGSFRSYAAVESDTLAWVVSASARDAFALETWWFPIVGSVPYRGFFSRETALSFAERLEERELETWVRGTDAFSTLGWFDDPLLSTTLKRTPASIVETVFHESVHSTVWIPGHVDFNESLANFIGMRAAEHFFQSTARPDLLLAQQRATAREFALSVALGGIYAKLKELYESNSAKEMKLAEREIIFERGMAAVRRDFPDLSVLQVVNNAEIMQLRLYLRELPRFDEQFQRCGGNFRTFLASMGRIAAALSSDSALDPFALLQQSVCS